MYDQTGDEQANLNINHRDQQRIASIIANLKAFSEGDVAARRALVEQAVGTNFAATFQNGYGFGGDSNTVAWNLVQALLAYGDLPAEAGAPAIHSLGALLQFLLDNQYILNPSDAAFLASVMVQYRPAPDDQSPAPGIPPLPSQLTTFIGRANELKTASAILCRSEVRLLTLTGPPGIGKTRLGLQIADDLSTKFPDGVFYIALETISDPDIVAEAIAEPLGIRETKRQSLLLRLRSQLQDKRLLLVLDNFEQVLSAAPLVTDLLQAAPNLKVLVTSRVALNVRGEQQWPVPPLTLPDLQHSADVIQLEQIAAVALFVDRAQAQEPDFRLTADNAPAVAQICVWLDGIPLAIELAAAHTKLLSPQTMLPLLEHRLRLLTGGYRDANPRQQTLRATIDWSYDLLDEGEKELFRRLAVFIGGCTLESAEAVCKADGDLPFEILNGLKALVDKNLLRRDVMRDGTPRTTMLETIREYAWEQLVESGIDETLRAQHTDYYLKLAEEITATQPGTSPSLTWMERLELERSNLRAALDWAAQQGDGEKLGRIAGALWRFWLNQGALSEGQRGLMKAVESPNLSPGVRAKVLGGLGVLTAELGHPEEAYRHFEEALSLYRELEDSLHIAGILYNMGNVATDIGDLENGQDWLAKARGHFEESLQLYRDNDNEYGIDLVEFGLAGLFEKQKDYEQAAQLYDKSLNRAEEDDNLEGIIWALAGLGRCAHQLGENQQAERRYVAGLRANYDAPIQIPIGFILCIEGLAEVAEAQRQPTRAAKLGGAAAALRDKEPAAGDVQRPTLDNARSQLGLRAWERAWNKGRRLTLEEVMRLVGIAHRTSTRDSH